MKPLFENDIFVSNYEEFVSAYEAGHNFESIHSILPAFVKADAMKLTEYAKKDGFMYLVMNMMGLEKTIEKKDYLALLSNYSSVDALFRKAFLYDVIDYYKDPEKANMLYLEAAKLGHKGALSNYACNLLDGIGIGKNEEKALTILKDLFEKGYYHSSIAIYSVTKNVDYYIKGLKAGNLGSLNNYTILHNGNFDSKDIGYMYACSLFMERGIQRLIHAIADNFNKFNEEDVLKLAWLVLPLDWTYGFELWAYCLREKMPSLAFMCKKRANGYIGGKISEENPATIKLWNVTENLLDLSYQNFKYVLYNIHNGAFFSSLPDLDFLVDNVFIKIVFFLVRGDFFELLGKEKFDPEELLSGMIDFGPIHDFYALKQK